MNKVNNKRNRAVVAIIASLLFAIAACSSTEPQPIAEQKTAITHTELPSWWLQWKKETEQSRLVIQQMTYNANLKDTDIAYDRFLEAFDENVSIYGLDEKTLDKKGVKEHYYPVFKFLKLALVNDVLIASGDQVMERYHAWRAFDANAKGLEFDGCQFNPKSGAFSIRGYTLFNIENDKIIRRYSNHDHGYRLAQTCKDQAKGDALKASLAGGFPDDKKVYAWADLYIKNLSAINESNSSRLEKSVSIFSDKAIIHGVKEGDGDVDDMKSYLSSLWKAFPDLIYHANGKATAWGRVAINYQAAGSHRGQWFNTPADHQPVLLTGEVILQFDQQGKVIEAWVYDHLESLDQPYY